MDRLNVIAVLVELVVDVAVAVLEAADLDAESLLDFVLVKVLLDIIHALVAETVVTLALLADIVGAKAGAVVRAGEGAAALAGRSASIGVTAVVAALDGLLAVGDGVPHGAAGALADLGWVATLATGHANVLGVLVQSVGQTIANQDTLEVDVGV